MLTAERLREVLYYDPETGAFLWRPAVRVGKGGNPYAGQPARQNKDVRGRIRLKVDGKIHFAHRLAWLYMTGGWPKDQIDHKDGNSSNNRWSNLREATPHQNSCNTRRPKSNTTGLKGVQFFKQYAEYKRPWRAMINANGKQYCLGYFATPEEAHAAYVKASKRLHGEFARAA